MTRFSCAGVVKALFATTACVAANRSFDPGHSSAGVASQAATWIPGHPARCTDCGLDPENEEDGDSNNNTNVYFSLPALDSFDKYVRLAADAPADAKQNPVRKAPVGGRRPRAEAQPTRPRTTPRKAPRTAAYARVKRSRTPRDLSNTKTSRSPLLTNLDKKTPNNRAATPAALAASVRSNNAAAPPANPTLAKRRSPNVEGLNATKPKWYGEQPNAILNRAVQRTREKVIMRDNDIILVTFPKSGTHWLASVVKNMLYPNPLTDDPVQEIDIPAPYVFHDVAVFWLLPESWLDSRSENYKAVKNYGQIPDAVFDKVNSIPEHIPRIFLSHMPAGFFEYAPTPKTRIIYLMREPHAVWHSVYKWNARLVSAVSDVLEEEGVKNTIKVISPEQFTKEFVRGQVRLPPRILEAGRDFTWAGHVREWYEKLQRMRMDNGQPAHIIDFNAAMEDPPAAVAGLARALQLPGWFDPGYDPVHVGELVADVVRRTEYHVLRANLQRFQGGELDVSANAHFGSNSHAKDPNAWKPAWERVLPVTRRLFDSITKRYNQIRSNVTMRGEGFLIV